MVSHAWGKPHVRTAAAHACVMRTSRDRALGACPAPAPSQPPCMRGGCPLACCARRARRPNRRSSLAMHAATHACKCKGASPLLLCFGGYAGDVLFQRITPLVEALSSNVNDCRSLTPHACDPLHWHGACLFFQNKNFSSDGGRRDDKN